MAPSTKHKTRLLAVNFGGIGDEILFLPTLSSIRGEHPDWHISLLLEPRSQGIAQVTKLIDHIITFDIRKIPLTAQDLMHLVGLMRQGNFDVVLSSGSSPLVAILLFLSGINKRVGYDSPLSRFLLTSSVTLNRNQYAANMYHDLVSGLGISSPADVPGIAINHPNEVKAGEILAHLGIARSLKGSGGSGEAIRRLVMIHPGTSSMAISKGIIKTWSSRCWTELIEKLCASPDIQVILAGGPDDGRTIAEIESAGAGLPLKSAAGMTGCLGDLAALISLCDLLICVDSAPMHLAVALGKPLVALFGPTDENKLLPADRRFLSLRDTTPTKGEGVLTPATSSRHKPSKPGVHLSPADVYLAVLDHLNTATDWDLSPP